MDNRTFNCQLSIDLFIKGSATTPNNPVSPSQAVCTVCTTRAKAAASVSFTPKHIKVAITIKCHGPIPP